MSDGSSDSSLATLSANMAPASLVDSWSPSFFERLRLDPLKTILEIGVGTLGSDKLDLTKSAGRLLLSMRSGNLLGQFFAELDGLQQKGQIKTDGEMFIQQHVQKSLLDILLMIDRNPEEERLEAVKALFILLVSVDQTEADEALTYQLFEIAKILSSSELITLKAVYDVSEDLNSMEGQLGVSQWQILLAKKLGHGIKEIPIRDVEKMIELRLIPEYLKERTAVYGQKNNFNLTPLGDRLYKAIAETPRIK